MDPQGRSSGPEKEGWRTVEHKSLAICLRAMTLLATLNGLMMGGDKVEAER
jgi:hypothetical protein